MKKLFIFLLILFFAELSANAEDINLVEFMKNYNEYVQQTVKNNLKYSGDENAQAIVSYEINSDGTVSNIKLDEKSGTPFDNAVFDAVEKSAPFKPIPKNLNISSVKYTSGFQHIVHKYQQPLNSSGISQNKYARMSITPVEIPEEVQQAYREYNARVSKYLFDRIPTTYSYIPKEPVIKCTILKDGALKNIQMERTSGIEEYDKNIIDTFSNLKVEPIPDILLQYYDEIPFSATVLRQFRKTPMPRGPLGFGF